MVYISLLIIIEMKQFIILLIIIVVLTYDSMIQSMSSEYFTTISNESGKKDK